MTERNEEKPKWYSWPLMWKSTHYAYVELLTAQFEMEWARRLKAEADLAMSSTDMRRGPME